MSFGGAYRVFFFNGDKHVACVRACSSAAAPSLPPQAFVASTDDDAPLMICCKSAFLDAVKAGKLAEVSKIMSTEDVDLNGRNENGDSALHIAVKNSLSEIADILLRRGANVNVTDTQGYTPLHQAVLFSDIGFVTKLLDFGADINAEGFDGYTPLHCAMKVKQRPVIKLLLSREAELDSAAFTGETTLHAASLISDASLADSMLRQKYFVHGVHFPTLGHLVFAGAPQLQPTAPPPTMPRQSCARSTYQFGLNVTPKDFYSVRIAPALSPPPERSPSPEASAQISSPANHPTAEDTTLVPPPSYSSPSASVQAIVVCLPRQKEVSVKNTPSRRSSSESSTPSKGHKSTRLHAEKPINKTTPIATPVASPTPNGKVGGRRPLDAKNKKSKAYLMNVLDPIDALDNNSRSPLYAAAQANLAGDVRHTVILQMLLNLRAGLLLCDTIA